MARRDPLGNFCFRLEIDGIQVAGFSEVVLGASSTDVIDYREGNEPTLGIRKLAGLTRYGNVVLKRGLTESSELYNWRKQVVDGAIATARRSVAVVVCDEARNDVTRFLVRNAWPAKYEAPAFNAKGNEVAIETLELANEGIEREQ
jgi:phage tail-like protein